MRQNAACKTPAHHTSISLKQTMACTLYSASSWPNTAQLMRQNAACRHQHITPVSILATNGYVQAIQRQQVPKHSTADATERRLQDISTSLQHQYQTNDGLRAVQCQQVAKHHAAGATERRLQDSTTYSGKYTVLHDLLHGYVHVAVCLI
jgi:hypothetical protein